MTHNIDDIDTELILLRKENARLKELLRKHEIAYEASTSPIVPDQKPIPQLSLEEKVVLFRSLFRGREDVFARRWYSPKTEKSCLCCSTRFLKSGEKLFVLNGIKPHDVAVIKLLNSSESRPRRGRTIATSASSPSPRSAAKSMSTAPTSTPSFVATA